MLISGQTLDMDRYLDQCRRLILDEIHRSGAALAVSVREGRPSAAPLGPPSLIRPALCIASGMALGGRLQQVLPVAAALELFQAGVAVPSVPQPLAGTLRRVCTRMARESLEGRDLQLRAQQRPLSGRDELRRVHKQIGWGAFIPAALLGSLSAGAQPDVVAAMARYGLLLAIASHGGDADIRQSHARRAGLLLRHRLAQLSASVHKSFLVCLIERCARLSA